MLNGIRRPTEPVTLVLTTGTAPLRVAMAELLNRSANTDATGAANQLYSTILGQLVPDEARILAALSDGKPRPAVDIVLRGPLGGRGTVQRNASTIGRAAGVSAPAYVPVYVTRLTGMGLWTSARRTRNSPNSTTFDDRTTRPGCGISRPTGESRRPYGGDVRTGPRFWQASDPTALP
ncbi:MAG TPA: Abi-alpha family protein [Pseudonocardiaceae bacterium]|nr:Abi-alpha family protein [Pseudonocardiaceae bacterium]